MAHETQRIRNASELAVIAQLQRSTWDAVFRNELGIKDINNHYKGPTTVRAMPAPSLVYESEDLEQKVVFIGDGTIANAAIYHRELGSNKPFESAPLLPVGNNVMKARITQPAHDFEYYIHGQIDGHTVTYPVTGGQGAGKINQTVITVKKLAQ